MSIGETENFYPDFLLWTANAVVCIDTKGSHLLRDDAGRKLLSIRPRTHKPRLLIRFVTEGKFNAQFEKLSPDGYTLWGLKDDGKPRAQHYENLEELLAKLAK